MTKFKINNKWENNLQFWIEGGNSKEKSNSQKIKKTKNRIQNNDDQSWNISKLKDNSKILNDQYEFWEEERERKKRKKKRLVATHHHIIDDTSTLYGKRHLNFFNAAMKIIVWMWWDVTHTSKKL
jgi:hypothetical protein